MPAQDAADRMMHQAHEAFDRGDTVLHLQFEVSGLGGAQSSWGSSENLIGSDDHVGYFLTHVEQIGWRLEHTGYTFVQTGASTSQKMWGTGEGVVTRGVVVGYFTFRRA
ncbi:hypothetical protein [Microbacterium sp. bgisy189]|uniref:hypothetical protein n=1 Tax=Microbacterium sp. bgisy189 TaxID=3413798 RepID=UPI003EB948E3